MEKSTKLLGGWGYILLIVGGFLGPLTFIFHFVGLAGIICLLIAFYQASKQLDRPKIWSNILVGIILEVVAFLLLIFMVGSAFLAAFHGGAAFTMGAIDSGAIIGGLIAWILWMVAAWFWYQASIPLAEATGISLYKTGGLLIFIGAITAIVFGLGLIVMLIGEIMQTVAFFTTTEKVPAGSPA
ncbi:MAG: DUF996 domain-containing protein [Gammaproteobacteria bacterium]